MVTAPRKMSDIMHEMSHRLLRNQAVPPSPEAASVALLFAHVAWNECVGLVHARDGYRNVWEAIEADNPKLWQELKSREIDPLVDELVKYKQKHYGSDRRRILVCGIVDGKIRVEWLPPAGPDIDVKWETQLYGLVRSGDASGAIRFLQRTRHLSRIHAARRVAKIAAELGMV